MPAKIKVSPNGPYLVEGEFEIVDAAGKPYEASKKMLALCRCGQTKNSPLCDGSHSSSGFEGPSEARPL